MSISLSMPLSKIFFHCWLGLSSNVLWAKCLPKGRMVAAGSPWTFQDTWRKKRAGKPLPCRAAFAEVRAHWKCMSEVSHLPHWQNTAGICCKCSARFGTFKGFSSLLFGELKGWTIGNFWKGNCCRARQSAPSTIVLCSLLLASRLIGCTQLTLESPAIHWATSAGICCLSSLVKGLTKLQPCSWPWNISTRETIWKPDCPTSLRRWSDHQPRQAPSSRPGLVRPGHWYRGLWKLGRLCLISRILLSKQFFLPSSICTRPTNAWVRETSSTSISTMFVSIFFCNTKP